MHYPLLNTHKGTWQSFHPLQGILANTNHLLTVARFHRSKLPTVWLHEFLQCPINALQLTFLTCFTAHQVCLVDVEYVCVCMKKEILREGFSQSRILWRVEQSDNSTAWDIEIALLCILINTNEQGLAEIVLTIFRMWGMGQGYLLSFHEGF